jgi:hypothetical protein
LLFAVVSGVFAAVGVVSTFVGVSLGSTAVGRPSTGCTW